MLTQNKIKARLAFAGRASFYDNDKISTSIPLGRKRKHESLKSNADNYLNLEYLHVDADILIVFVQDVLKLVATGYPVGFYSREPMADLNALKEQTWRTASFWHISYLENAGATNKRIPWGERVSDSLRSGAIDGIMVNIDSGWDIGAHRAAPHLLVSQELWLGHIYLVAMNLDRWNALPPKDKRAIERAASKTYKAMGKTMDESYEQMLQQLSNEGCTVRRLTHEEVSDFVVSAFNDFTTIC